MSNAEHNDNEAKPLVAIAILLRSGRHWTIAVTARDVLVAAGFTLALPVWVYCLGLALRTDEVTADLGAELRAVPTTVPTTVPPPAAAPVAESNPAAPLEPPAALDQALVIKSARVARTGARLNLTVEMVREAGPGLARGRISAVADFVDADGRHVTTASAETPHSGIPFRMGRSVVKHLDWAAPADARLVGVRIAILDEKGRNLTFDLDEASLPGAANGRPRR